MSKKEPRLQTLNSVLRRCKITTWDVLLIGDGSGVGWTGPIGWACTLIDRASGQRKLFTGAANSGTITLAEAFPYLFAMLWYSSDSGPGPARVSVKACTCEPVYVHIVTDSEALVKLGNNRQSRKANKPLWSAFDGFGTLGYALKFHHVGRDTIDLNTYADMVAGTARAAAKQFADAGTTAFCKRYPGIPDDVQLHDICPNE